MGQIAASTLRASVLESVVYHDSFTDNPSNATQTLENLKPHVDAIKRSGARIIFLETMLHGGLISGLTALASVGIKGNGYAFLGAMTFSAAANKGDVGLLKDGGIAVTQGAPAASCTETWCHHGNNTVYTVYASIAYDAALALVAAIAPELNNVGSGATPYLDGATASRERAMRRLRSTALAPPMSKSGRIEFDENTNNRNVDTVLMNIVNFQYSREEKRVIRVNVGHVYNGVVSMLGYNPVRWPGGRIGLPPPDRAIAFIPKIMHLGLVVRAKEIHHGVVAK